MFQRMFVAKRYLGYLIILDLCDYVAVVMLMKSPTYLYKLK